MSIISKSLVKDNLDFAIANIQTTLTAVTPTNAETYSANKQDIQLSYISFEDGREQTIDTRFYIAIDDYSTLPSKGMILTDGTRNYKVTDTMRDALGVTLRVDCSSEYQR